jgi:uncharacterized cupredoxin-like copper-binding protein
MLKRAPLLVFVVLAAFHAFAQHDHHMMTDDDYRQLVASMSSHGPVIPQPLLSVAPAATKPFNITARSFSFTVSPSSFVVNQGDVVDITFSVPSNDAATSHGILMETYIEQGVDVNRGQSKSISFTATTAGTFVFVCNVPSCGVGHSNMFGQLVVNPQSNPAPAVTGIDPGSGSTLGGQSVTISGTNFASGASVSFGGSAATNVVTSGTTISATTPAHGAGPVTVTVTNADGQSGSRADAYTYTLPGPTLSGISPSSGPTSGGTAVTITGTGFAPGASVTIGNVPATDVSVVDSGTIRAVTPLGPANEQVGFAVPVKVTNPDSKSASSNLFTYTVPPLAIHAVDPAAGPVSGGTIVTIRGTGFTTAVQTFVTFGGAAATNVQVLDAVTLRATTPAHAAGSVNVAVNIGSSTATATNAFAYGTPTPKKRAVRH